MIMRRLWTLLTCLALTGCLVDTEETVDPATDVPVQEDEPGYPEGASHGGGNHATGCGFQSFEVLGPHGELVELIIPLECNPYWWLDPPPDWEEDRGQEHVNPNPRDGLEQEWDEEEQW